MQGLVILSWRVLCLALETINICHAVCMFGSALCSNKVCPNGSSCDSESHLHCCLQLHCWPRTCPLNLCFLQGSSGLNVEQRMFDVLVERKHPRLIEVFDRLECSLGGLTGEWFGRMFTTALPAETTARVWDCVMVEGPKVLFRAALSLIKVRLRRSSA